MISDTRGSRIRHSGRVLLIGVILSVASEVRAQDLDVLDAAVRLAVFEDASRLASDAFGNLYVIDRGAGRLVRLSPDSEKIERIGGSGSPLSDPAGVDPGNGLLIFVSDRTSGRIIRFSRDLVPRGVIRANGYAAGFRDETMDDRATVPIQPTDIAVGREGDLFVIDRQQRTVLKFDALYHLERRIGEFGSGRGELSDPILLTLSREGRQLFVVDADEADVFVYDMNGSFLRRIVRPDDREVVSIRDTPGGLLILHADGASVLRDDDWYSWAAPDSFEPLTDALIVQDILYLLTKRWLYRTGIPEPGN